jgi:hypothetical protein
MWPARAAGGGALGEVPVNAVLIGVMTDPNEAADDTSRLRTGSRAIFDSECEGVGKRVITSRAVKLTQADFRCLNCSRPA